MASKPGRKTNNWRTPEGRLCRCVATHLYRDGLKKAELVRRFKATLPEYQCYFPNPVSDDSIWMRGYLGSKPGYEREWPDRNPKNEWHWQTARILLDNGYEASVDEIRPGEGHGEDGLYLVVEVPMSEDGPIGLYFFGVEPLEAPKQLAAE